MSSIKIVQCDWCGKQEIVNHVAHITSFEIRFQYGSRFDGNVHAHDVCDDCYVKVFERVKK